MSTEKKTINYNGMELECIESGYWPEGVTLVGEVHGEENLLYDDVICLGANRCFLSTGDIGVYSNYWAILPPKPAPRRLTNRELAGLCRKGWDLCNIGIVLSHHHAYEKVFSDMPCSITCHFVRAPNSDEWLEPTSDLLERV